MKRKKSQISLHLHAFLVLFLFCVSFLHAVDLPKQLDVAVGKTTFMKNEGQWNDGSLYHFRSGFFQAGFYPDKIVFTIATPKDKTFAVQKPVPGEETMQDPEVLLQVWEIRYLQSQAFRYTAVNPVENKIGYASIHQNGNIVYPQQFENLKITNLYEGVDAVFSSKNGIFKIDYIIKQGIHPNIEFNINGFTETGLDERGNIRLTSKYGQLIDSIPYSYESNDAQTALDVKYIQTGKSTFAIRFPEDFKNNHGAVVDPFYLDYSTFFYGSSLVNPFTYIYDVNVDGDNNSYITGITYDKFPGKPGTYDTTLAGASDAYLCKIPSGGGAPDFFVYIGGLLADYGYAMATLENGDAYITGYTNSLNFPVTPGVLEPVKPVTTSYTLSLIHI